MGDLGIYGPVVAVLALAFAGAGGFAKWLDARAKAIKVEVAAIYDPQIHDLEERVKHLENGQGVARDLLVQALEECTELEVRKFLRQAVSALH